MSNSRSSSNIKELTTSTDKLHRSHSETFDESVLKSDEALSPEELAAIDGRSLLHQKDQRDLDLIDGMQSTADVIDKILDMISELMMRMRQLESLYSTSPPSKKSRGGCKLNCVANNASYTL